MPKQPRGALGVGGRQCAKVGLIGVASETDARLHVIVSELLRNTSDFAKSFANFALIFHSDFPGNGFLRRLCLNTRAGKYTRRVSSNWRFNLYGNFFQFWVNFD